MEYYEVIARLLLAIIIGGAIGYERQYKNRPAGFRTHILVCVGAAVVSMTQVYLVQETITLVLNNPELSSAIRSDGGRMPSQVITGIGFLGAGTIIRDRGSIKGLTTAATVWVVGCIGLSVGYGYYLLSIVAGILVFLILVSLKNLEKNILKRGDILEVDITYQDKTEVSEFFRAYFSNNNIKVKNIEYILNDELDEDDIGKMEGLVNGKYTLLVPRHISSSDVLYNMLKHELVFKAKLED
ncbi:MAG: MgtC/SapB family protein [Epulopiscium sp.]|nr:MgtC/SapB family protein [Candidatus Epulonipiscium sp.]